MKPRGEPFLQTGFPVLFERSEPFKIQNIPNPLPLDITVALSANGIARGPENSAGALKANFPS